ncbi:MAG: hypothetical protein WCU88_12880 [Elusimicrobiota bacterium]|jgi:hypothetical protein
MKKELAGLLVACICVGAASAALAAAGVGSVERLSNGAEFSAQAVKALDSGDFAQAHQVSQKAFESLQAAGKNDGAVKGFLSEERTGKSASMIAHSDGDEPAYSSHDRIIIIPVPMLPAPRGNRPGPGEKAGRMIGNVAGLVVTAAPAGWLGFITFGLVATGVSATASPVVGLPAGALAGAAVGSGILYTGYKIGGAVGAFVGRRVDYVFEP